MRRSHCFALALTGLLAGLTSAQPPEPEAGTPSGVPAESRLGEQAETAGQPENKLGPTPVQDVQLFQDLLRRLCHQAEEDNPATGKPKPPPLRIFGWVDMGYTASTSGRGPLAVEPKPNRFGNEFTLNQLALTIEKPLDPKELSWGFVIRPYAGSDAALLTPIQGAIVQSRDSRFGVDFRDLYLQAHLPILTEGGVDIEAGQHYPLIGYQSAMAPYRTFYSNDYQWFWGEAGNFTGIIVTCHATKQLDIVSALTFGYITFFTNLSVSPTYMGRIDYWLQENKKTLFSVGCVTGPAMPHSGANTTLADLTVTQNWTNRLTQIVQFGAGYSKNGVAGLGLQRYYGLYNIFLYHTTATLDVNVRAEWYNDVDGHGYPGGTGFRNHYEEVTLGLDYHPRKWLQLRPELRADFANNTPAFGPESGPRSRSQFTPALECLIKF